MQPGDPREAAAAVIAQVVTVTEAVAAELSRLDGLGVEASGSPLGAAAFALAAEIDSPGTSATAKSLCVRALRECLTDLWEQTPDELERNPLDELRARRASRDGGAAA